MHERTPFLLSSCHCNALKAHYLCALCGALEEIANIVRSLASPKYRRQAITAVLFFLQLSVLGAKVLGVETEKKVFRLPSNTLLTSLLMVS